MTNQNELTAEREIVLSRVLNAPRELVWKVWTEKEHLGKWWGPQGFTITTHQRELKPGGVWRYVMHGPDGRDYENVTTFIEVVPVERLVYKQGGEVECQPINFHVTVTFEKVGDDKTKLTMRSVFDSKEARDFVIRECNVIEGGKQHLARLGEYLQFVASTIKPGSQPFVMTHVFSVPPERMWSVWTDRDHLMRWFGPKAVAIPKSTLDLRPGGVFHYCMRGPDGKDMWGKWTFRTIAKPERLEFLVSFADDTGATIRAPFDPSWPLEMLSIVTFAHHAGVGHGTVVRLEWSAFEASEAEQKTFDAGHESMKQGWTGTFEKLAEFLEK